LEFLKEQLKNMEEEADEKIKLITQNMSVDKNAVREKEQEVEKLKEMIAHYKTAKEELEKEIVGLQTDNKRKEENIILLQKEIELKLTEQKEKLNSEFSKKMAEIEKRYETERKMVEESLLNANTQNLSEIEKLKKEIEIFKNAQSFQKAILDAKKNAIFEPQRTQREAEKKRICGMRDFSPSSMEQIQTINVARTSVRVSEAKLDDKNKSSQYKEPVFTKIWEWLNEPV